MPAEYGLLSGRHSLLSSVNLPLERISTLSRAIRHIGGNLLIRLLSRGSRIQEHPVFVLGNQKSGTTVIAALLAKYAGVSSTIDFRYPSSVELIKVLTGELSMKSFVRRRAWHFTRKVIKEPGLTYVYEPLARRFPDAQFVMIIRDPRDNIRSILNRLDISGDLENITPEHLGAMNLIWRKILKGEALGLQGSNYIDTLALRWNDAAETYLKHSDNVHLIRYEDFNAEKAQSIADLAQTLGLPQENDISAEVDVQYVTRGNRKISWEDFYSDRNLKLIENRCGEYLERLDYDNRGHVEMG